ncbi:MAG TPA: polysaccharide biosynthesis tyrosine autokinase [Tepidisphaeraceae bacterium]
MLQRRPTASRIVEYGTGEDRVDIPSRTPAAGPNPGAAAAGRSSASVFQILWRRKWLMICSAIVAVGAGIVYLTQATPIYSAATQINIQQSGPQILANQAGGPNTMNFLTTQCDVIRSTRVIQEALKAPEMSRAKSLEASENPVALVKLAVTATAGQKSDIITITAESPYPEDAAIFANTVCDAYRAFENSQHRSLAADIVTLLEKEKTKEDEEYQRLSDQMVAFKRTNGTLALDGTSGNFALTRLNELSAERTRAQLEAMQAKIQAEQAEAFKNDPAKMQAMMATSQWRGMDGGAPIRAQIATMSAVLNEMQGRFGPNYPQCHSLELSIQRLREQAFQADQEAAQAYVAALQGQSDAAQKRATELEQAFNSAKQDAIDQGGKQAEYAQITMAMQRSEKVADFLNSRIKEFQLTRDNTDEFNIAVLETAKAPSVLLPVRPNRPQVLAIALAIGLMAGMGGALLLDMMDHRIRSASEVEQLLGLPILGAVPHMLGKRSAIERGQEIHLYPKSEVAESYRTIRTGIRFGMTDAASKTLLVTSPSPGDGKTTVASNLAIALAQTGKRVLLIDADCRRPMMQRIYSLPAETGLSTVLTGQSELAAAVQRSNTDNMDILPCGPLPPNPAEMLNSEAFTSVLRELAAQYDHVVVDSPPVAPVTDARILAAACDATLMVIRAEKTSRRVAEHARDALASVGAVLLGVVVNDAPRSRSEASGYGHYSYSYGYGYGYGYGSKGNGRPKEVKAIGVANVANPA